MKKHYFFESAAINQKWQNLIAKSIIADSEQDALEEYYEIVKRDFGYDDETFAEWQNLTETRLSASGNYAVFIVGGPEDGKTIFESPYEDHANKAYDKAVEGLDIDSDTGIGFVDPLGNDIAY